MWGETSGFNLFINDYSSDSDGAMSMQLCDSKRS